MLEHADTVRRQVSPRINQTRKAELGQFMTPAGVARFMASLFSDRTLQTCLLLDPGAGIGALSCAFLDRLTTGRFHHVEVTAFEIDNVLRAHLETTFPAMPRGFRFSRASLPVTSSRMPCVKVCRVRAAIRTQFSIRLTRRSTALRSTALILRRVGIETVNLYSAFVALALALLAPGGQLVAIIPRSFCNGPYYRPFRDFLFQIAPPSVTCTCSLTKQGIQG